MKNIIFFGSDIYSSTVLSKLLESNLFTSISVVTDRPKSNDKSKKVEPNPVENIAIAHKLKVSYYPSLAEGTSKLVEVLKNWIVASQTCGLCASFDHLLPSEIIELFNGDLYNLHPSILPQYRNVSPVQYALALGDKKTGITLFRISVGIDNGEIISQAEENITPNDTTISLTPRLFSLGAELFITCIKNGFTPSHIDIDSNNLIFTKRLSRDSGYIEWDIIKKLLNNTLPTGQDTENTILKLRLDRNLSEDGLAILNDLVHAFTPWPTVWTYVPIKRNVKGSQEIGGKTVLRISIETVIPEVKIKISGKPNAISWADFQKYYLSL